jgi:hypothetical protein
MWGKHNKIWLGSKTWRGQPQRLWPSICNLPWPCIRARLQRGTQTSEPLPIFGINVSLIENASQSSDWNFAFSGDDGRIDNFTQAPDELYVATLLRCFGETSRFKPPLDLAEGLRINSTQLRPRLVESLRAV